MVLFPLVLSSLSDAVVALNRISKFLTAEELAEPYLIDHECKDAVRVDGDFTWERAGKIEEAKFIGPEDAHGKERGKSKSEKDKGEDEGQRGVSKGSDKAPAVPAEQEGGGQGGSQGPEEKPFELNNLKFSVPRGSFVAIVGRVGSGKVGLPSITSCSFDNEFTL